MTSPSRTAWFIWPLVLLAVAGAALLLLFPKVLTGDFAEITIESVTPTGPGEVEIRYRGRISEGTGLFVARPEDFFQTGYQGGPGRGRFGGRPMTLETYGDPGVQKIYSLRNEQGELGTPAEVLGRLSVKAGRTYVAKLGRPVRICSYTASDGALVELLFAVWRR